MVIGEGEYKFEVQHGWAQLPDRYTWQTTHNVAVDAEGLLYVIHEGRANQKDHPSIFVFDQKGKFIRAFGNQFQGGGHGIEFSHRLDDQIDGPLATGFTIAGFYENRWNDEATSLNRFMPTSMAILAFLSSSY